MHRRRVLTLGGSVLGAGIIGSGIAARSTEASHLDNPPEMVERNDHFDRSYEDCGAFDDYDHQFQGYSVELADNIGAIGIGGIAAVIGWLAQGGPIAAAAGGMAAAAVELYSEEETMSFGVREYDRSYVDLHTQTLTAGFVAAEWKPSPHRTVATSTWPTHKYY